jgi:serine/threonine-protein phosphatase PGAM5
VLVCHGNVIRYFLTRALQIDPEAWLRFSLANGAITVIKVTPSGNCSLQMIGCAGFMPTDSVTFN